MGLPWWLNGFGRSAIRDVLEQFARGETVRFSGQYAEIADCVIRNGLASAERIDHTMYNGRASELVVQNPRVCDLGTALLGSLNQEER